MSNLEDGAPLCAGESGGEGCGGSGIGSSASSNETHGSGPAGGGTLRDVGNAMDVDGDRVDTTSSMGTAGYGPRTYPEVILAPGSPPRSAQVLPSPRSSMQHPASEPSPDGNCGQRQFPFVDQTQYEQLTWDQPHEQCSQREYHRKESQEALETRLGFMGAADAKCTRVGGDDMDASETMCGKRARAPVEGVAGLDISAQSSSKICRAGELRAPFVADSEVVKEHSQWRRYGMGGNIDTQSREDPGAPSVICGGGPRFLRG